VKTNTSNLSKINSEGNYSITKHQSIELKSINLKKEEKTLNPKGSKISNKSECRDKNEKSCQTSKDLMLPMFDQELRRRKAYGITESDQMFDILNNINDSFDIKPDKVNRQINRTTSLFDKQLKSPNHIIEHDGEKYSQFCNNNENSKTSPRNQSMKMNTPSRITKSFKEFMVQKKLIKELRKSSDISSNGSYSLFEPIENISDELKAEDIINQKSTNTNICKDNTNTSPENFNTIQRSLSKINESFEDKISNQNSSANDENEKLIYKEKNQNPLIENDSSVSSSLSNLNINLIIEENSYNLTDIENEFMFTLDEEDENLEKFKKIFTRDKNLILNWDYVQSSDYL
jgi:hypothetical protein